MNNSITHVVSEKNVFQIEANQESIIGPGSHVDFLTDLQKKTFFSETTCVMELFIGRNVPYVVL
jgi:hypothetical protein